LRKRDLGSKLKARLDEWEAYGERPVQPSRAAAEHRTGRAEGPGEPDLSESFALVPIEDSADAVVTGQAASSASEARIGDLKVALDHERDQSRPLMDVVAREQVLHAVTLHGQLQPPASHRGVVRTREWEPEPRRPNYDTAPGTGRGTYILLIFLTLLIGFGFYGVVYLVVH